jgi:hypothetical protein
MRSKMWQRALVHALCELVWHLTERRPRSGSSLQVQCIQDEEDVKRKRDSKVSRTRHKSGGLCPWVTEVCLARHMCCVVVTAVSRGTHCSSTASSHFEVILTALRCAATRPIVTTR